jgi:hypothetical protein
MANGYRNIIVKAKGKSNFGRTRYRWEDNGT